MTFRNGAYRYQILYQGNRGIYTVSDGVTTISEPVLYSFGMGKLEAHQPRNRAADDPREDREDQIERADVLVVRRHEPAGEEARHVMFVLRMPMRIAMGLEGFGDGGSHDLRTLSFEYGLRRREPEEWQWPG